MYGDQIRLLAGLDPELPGPPTSTASVRWFHPPAGKLREVRGAARLAEDPAVFLHRIKVAPDDVIPVCRDGWQRIGYFAVHAPRRRGGGRQGGRAARGGPVRSRSGRAGRRGRAAVTAREPGSETVRPGPAEEPPVGFEPTTYALQVVRSWSAVVHSRPLSQVNRHCRRARTRADGGGLLENRDHN
ncbi:hypothetical protein [Streptomyces sp. CA2R106]|uniref:hypothetical protein n=1 Tax=Streptomyces sp. CA2R106 TaxID=3120153 RepID=UPI003FA73529